VPSAARPRPRAKAQWRPRRRWALSSAIGAYGGFFIPKSFGTALQLTGSAAPALVIFIVFYLSCIALTWRHYSRPNAPCPAEFTS
jgi:nitrate/nitrite transporter NarK